MTSLTDMPADIVEAAEKASRQTRGTFTSDQDTLIIARAILAERQRHSAVRPFNPEQAAVVAQIIAGGNGFADTDPEARFIADGELSCSHCGGSGHKDDVNDQWQDVATAPKDGTQILVSIHGWNDPSEKYFFAVVEWEDGRWMEGSDAVYPPTHWQPLPSPPKGS